MACRQLWNKVKCKRADFLSLLRGIVNEDDTLGLLTPLGVSLLLLLLSRSELVALLSRLQLLLPPDLNTLDELLLTALAQLDPLVSLNRVRLADKEVGDGEGIGVGRSGRLERLVRFQGCLERRELGAGALGVGPGLLVDVEVGQVCHERGLDKGRQGVSPFFGADEPPRLSDSCTVEASFAAASWACSTMPDMVVVFV